MNKKGFTLVEIVAVVAIIGLIGVLVVGNLSGNLSKEEDEQYKLFKKILSDAACTYINSNDAKEVRRICMISRSCTVKVDTLYKNGYITEDNLNDPSKEYTTAEIKNQDILIYRDDDNTLNCYFNSADRS